MLEPKEYEIEPGISKELDGLISLLIQKDEIIKFKGIEKQVQANRWIKETIEQIKNKQRDLVNFEYYEKPEAYRKTLGDLDQLNKDFFENITVQAYRDTLAEANDVVQLIFSQIQNAIDLIND